MTNGEKLEQIFPDGICPFSKSWLDCEYKEPLTKVNQDLTKNKSEIPTSSTTKNDLVVDCVSRQFMYELGATCIATRNENGNLMALGAIEELPPATPIRPKGHWIEYSWNDNGFARWGLECDKCHKKYKYGGEIWNNPNFCPNCGAEMNEVEE
jgi:hypothetical protein